MTLVATIDDLLAHLPTLTARQVSTLAIAVPPPDGSYTITLADAAASATASGSLASAIRDELLAEIDGTAVASVEASGAAALELTGAEWGVAFAVSASGPTGGLTVSTSAASGLPQRLLERYLGMARRLVANRVIWGDNLVDGQALRALHLLARSGQLETYGVLDPGETGQLVSSALGPSSSSFAAPVVAEGSHSDLASTRWGRAYWEIWRTIRPQAAGTVIR